MVMITLACAFLFNCGGGSQGTGAFDSGLPKSAVITSLTEPQRQQICQRFTEIQEMLFAPTPLCTYVGIISTYDSAPYFSNTAEGCESTKKYCLDNYDSIAPRPDDFSECPIEPSQPIECNQAVLVEAMDQCIGDILDASFENFLGLQCSDFSKFSTVEEFERYALPEKAIIPQTDACIELQNKCPNFLKGF